MATKRRCWEAQTNALTRYRRKNNTLGLHRWLPLDSSPTWHHLIRSHSSKHQLGWLLTPVLSPLLLWTHFNSLTPLRHVTYRILLWSHYCTCMTLHGRGYYMIFGLFPFTPCFLLPFWYCYQPPIISIRIFSLILAILNTSRIILHFLPQTTLIHLKIIT